MEPSPRAWAGRVPGIGHIDQDGAVPACVGRTSCSYRSAGDFEEPSPRAWAGHSLTWANAVPDVQPASLRDGRGITPTR